jgi:preprotein translocase subunit SecF
MIGIAVGTYSSIFIASPLAFDFITLSNKRKKRKAELKKATK